MEFRDYYAILGVDRDATQDDIKRAYRRLARKYHPDVSTDADAEDQFKALGEAYEVLKDPEKRAAYDRLGANWREGEQFRPPPDWDAGFEFSGGGFTGADSEAFSDFFESLFGGRRPGGFGRQRARGAHAGRGEDHHARILIDPEDAFSGATRTVTLQVPQVTPDGHVEAVNRTLKVKVPKGIRPGQHIRLSGQGGAGPGGRNGDLFLEVSFREHPLYRVDGADVYLDLPVTPDEAALGVTVDVPTPGGAVALKVPPGSQAGRQLRLKGRGLPGRMPGDMYAVLQVLVPPANTDELRKAYEALAKASTVDIRAHLKREGVA